jgi:hypothetical protein
MSIIGFATVVWRVAISFEKRDEKSLMIEKQLIEVNKSVIDLNMSVEDLETGQEYLRSEIKKQGILTNKVVESQNGLRSSYIKFIKNDKSLTVDEFLNYMQGIEVGVKRDDFKDSLKIIIRKK